MRLAVIVLVLLVSSCCAKPKPCPTLPVRPVSEPVVTVVAERLPCTLPELPMPMRLVGFPSPDGTQIYVSRSDMGALAIYLAGMRAWIQAAAQCLR